MMRIHRIIAFAAITTYAHRLQWLCENNHTGIYFLMRTKIRSWFGKSPAAENVSLAADLLQQPWSQTYSPIATETDVFQCFRLLLGRNPHREEWAGHAARTGENLEKIVAEYLGSLEFERRGLIARRQSQDLSIASVQGFQIYVAHSDSDVGYHVAMDSYEPDVTIVFRRLLRQGMGVIDIGANIGYFSMLSAKLVGPEGHVLAVEPNPRNAKMLEASRRLNDYSHITVAQVAAGRTTGLLALHAAHSNGTTSEPSGSLDALLAAETVPSLRLDNIVSPDRSVGLIKLDVEGAEYNAVLGCQDVIARDRPIIISEFSPELMPGISGVSGLDYLRWLMAYNYRVGCIQPDGSVSAAGQDPNRIMAEYAARLRDHIDIVATPV